MKCLLLAQTTSFSDLSFLHTERHLLFGRHNVRDLPRPGGAPPRERARVAGHAPGEPLENAAHAVRPADDRAGDDGAGAAGPAVGGGIVEEATAVER